MIGLHYSWYLGMVFSFLPVWKGLLFVVLSQVGTQATDISSMQHADHRRQDCQQRLQHVS
jgi:hypothetical protein